VTSELVTYRLLLDVWLTFVLMTFERLTAELLNLELTPDWVIYRWLTHDCGTESQLVHFRHYSREISAWGRCMAMAGLQWLFVSHYFGPRKTYKS
jgi:hypothetical protein